MSVCVLEVLSMIVAARLSSYLNYIQYSQVWEMLMLGTIRVKNKSAAKIRNEKK